MIRKIFFLGLLVYLNIGCQSHSIEAIYSDKKEDINAYNLISANEANNLLSQDSSKYIIVQVSKSKIYLQGHLPNALNIWRPDYGSDQKIPFGGLIPSREKLQTLLRKLGFEKEKQLILYDAKANVDAFRFAWVLNLYGFDNFKILNGGLKHWEKEGYLVSKEKSEFPQASQYVLASEFNESLIADFDDVLEAIRDSNVLLIDTRETYENIAAPFIKNNEVFDFKKGAFCRGSIPTAIHLNWSTLGDLNGDHRIKSEKNLRYDLTQVGITENKEIILYCQSGSRTSHTFYVLKHVLGFSNVKNYDGSWIEYSYQHSLSNEIPIEQKINEQEFALKKDSLLQSILSDD